MNDLVIVTGYRAEEIRAYAECNFPNLSYTFVHNERYEETNNIHSMALAFEAVDFCDGLVLIESDLIFDESVLDTLDSCSHENVALLDRYKPGMDGTVVKMDSRCKIVSVIPGSQQLEGFDFNDTFKTLNIYRFSGLFASTVFSPMVRFYAQTLDDNCYYELILGMLIAIGHADVHGALVPANSWSEVDDPVDLRQARFLSTPQDRRTLLDEAWGGYWGLDIIDFAFIRNMHFPTPQMINEIRLQMPELMASYCSSQKILDRKMSWFLGVPEGRVVAINGASQFFPWAGITFGNRSVWLQEPTFGEWNRSFPQAQTYPDSGDGLLHLPQYLPREAVAIIVNPNNPTGTTIATKEVYSVCASNPDTTFLVDESFIQFSGEISMIQLLELDPLDNVVVVQSLSKTLGVPGVRIGCIYSTNTDVLDAFRASLPIWNMNSVAEKYIELLLKTRPALERSYVQTQRDRQDLCQRLTDVPRVRSVWPSGGNFVLVELDVDRPHSRLFADQLLSDHRLYVKEVSHKLPGSHSYWRLAVRTPAEHEHLVEALTIVLASGVSAD